MKMIFVRHGRTTDNEKGIKQGHYDGILSRTGRRQVKQAAEKLRDCKIDVIYTSDLGRAVDTAREIARYHKSAPFIPAKALRERNPGIYSGTPQPAERKARRASGRPRHLWRPPGGESWIDVNKRGKKFLEMIKKRYRRKTVLLVGHQRSNGIFIAILLKDSIKNVLRYKQPNAGITILDVPERGGAKIVVGVPRKEPR